MRYYDGWKPYVSVAARRAKAERAAAKARKAGAVLAPIAAHRGATAKTVWGRSWCENLERYSDYSNRLPRGRSYARNGSVLDLQISTGKVSAQVMGSSLYTVVIEVQAVPAPQWQALCKACAGAIDSLVEILQGRLSAAVMAQLCQPGKGLFPSPKEISFDCSCPDSASMCKHIAAVLYGVGARLDQQPELLFGLRHVDAKDLITEAGAGLQQPPADRKSSKVLQHASLGDVFGIEMTEAQAPAKKAFANKPAAKKVAAKKVAAKKAPARKVSVKTLPAAAKNKSAEKKKPAAKKTTAAKKATASK